VKLKKSNNFIHSAPPQAAPKTIVPGRIGIAKLWHSLRQLTCQAV
jgi:hypothetical protein